MSAAETVAELLRFDARAPGSDAERRAATWLAGQLGSRSPRPQLEAFWCRPNWALGQSWHVALGLAGSLLSVSHPRVGGLLVIVALLCVALDGVSGRSPGRRLTPERASQNVVLEAPDGDPRVRLIVTANLDAGRMGFVYRRGPRSAAARLRRLGAGRSPGWLGWLTVTLASLLAIAVLRLNGAGGGLIGVAQLIPTVGLVIALALLLELAVSPAGPGASDNASGTAVALALVRALDAAPPPRLAVELVLQGAAEGGGIGLRRHLRARRSRRSPANTVVLGIAPCGAGRPRWWISDGALLPLRYHSRLRQLAERVAEDEPHLEAAGHRGRGATVALAARVAGLPTIAIGCLDELGVAPLSHTPQDTGEHLEESALDATLALALLLVDALDADLAHRPPA